MTVREQLDCVIDEIRNYPQEAKGDGAQLAALIARREELEEALLSERDEGREE